MPRIRSIKPEFWCDGEVHKLSDAAALFFVGIWNFCDDQGRCTTDPSQLSLWMPRFRAQNVKHWLRELQKKDLIKISREGGHLLVVNWHHQNIKKPRPGDPNLDKIEFGNDIDLSNDGNLHA